MRKVENQQKVSCILQSEVLLDETTVLVPTNIGNPIMLNCIRKPETFSIGSRRRTRQLCCSWQLYAAHLKPNSQTGVAALAGITGRHEYGGLVKLESEDLSKHCAFKALTLVLAALSEKFEDYMRIVRGDRLKCSQCDAQHLGNRLGACGEVKGMRLSGWSPAF